MLKRIIALGVMLIMAFSLGACNGELAQYKAAAKKEIEDYAENKDEENYSADGWAEIVDFVETGKAAVDAAENKPAVDTAVATAKTAIDAVEREEVSMGKFYVLQEAFAKGFLTKDDIMHISQFATGKVIEVIDATGNAWAMELDLPESYWTKIKKVDFTPQQMKPSLADLSEQRIVDMKVAFYEANQVIIDGSLQLAISDGTLNAGTTALESIVVQEFLGAYNGFYAVRITSTLLGYGGATVSQLVSDIGWNLPGAPTITVFTI